MGSENTSLVEVPVIYDFDDDNSSDDQETIETSSSEEEAEELEEEEEKLGEGRTNLVELLEPFNFILPTHHNVPIEDELTRKLALGDEIWLPVAERLTGWTREIRRRPSGRLDTFYYHKKSGTKRYRSFRDVKRYIYLGFFPSDENGDGPLEQLALKQPNPILEEPSPGAL